MIDNVTESVNPSASVTPKVGETVPAEVGVPVTAPLEGLRDSPAGRPPEVIDQVNGVVPPLAVSVSE